MRKIRITSDGTPHGTELFDEATGKQILGRALVPRAIIVGAALNWTGTLIEIDPKNFGRDLIEEVELVVGLERPHRGD